MSDERAAARNESGGTEHRAAAGVEGQGRSNSITSAFVEAVIVRSRRSLTAAPIRRLRARCRSAGRDRSAEDLDPGVPTGTCACVTETPASTVPRKIRASWWMRRATRPPRRGRRRGEGGSAASSSANRFCS